MATDAMNMTPKQAERTLAEAAEREAREVEARRVLREDKKRRAEAVAAERRKARVARQKFVVAKLRGVLGEFAELTPEERSRIAHEVMMIRTGFGRAFEMPAVFDGFERALEAEQRRLAELEQQSKLA